MTFKILTDYFEAAVAKTPNKVAVVDNRFGSLTYGALFEKTQRLAFGLLNLGISSGDLVIVQLPNWHQFIVFKLALCYLGATTVPVTPSYRQKELGDIAKLTKAKAIVVPDHFRGFSYLNMVEGLSHDNPSLKHIFVVGENSLPGMHHYDNFMSHSWESTGHLSAFGQTKPGLNDVTDVLFTSGTTGEPKGVMRESITLAKINALIADYYDLTSADVVFMPNPVTHASGLWHGVRLPIFLGATTVLQDRWDPEEALKICQREKCTFSIAMTAVVQDLIYHPSLEEYGRLGSMRHMAMPGAIQHILRDAYRILSHCVVSSCYAGTDFGFISGCRSEDPLEKRFTTDGKPLPGNEVRVVNSEEGEVSPDHEGQLLVRGLNLIGYYGRPDLNSQALASGGFFRTGDVGKMDKDGYLNLTGRLKDIIRRGGFNISPLEVERTLLEHPKVDNVALVGVPDPRLQERACACIIPKHGETITLREVQQWMEKHGLAKQKWPEVIEIFDSFPLSVFGRVQKFLIREEVKKRLGLKSE